MALPLAKVTILVGAGIVGSVFAAKEGSASTVSNFLSGAAKIVWRQLRDDSSTSRSSTVKKPPNDALMAQVNNLRQELQLLASNKPVTIITTNRGGSSKYGVVIVIVVVGYGYVWWKGWKLPDLMFATRKSLSDACNSVSKKLETVYTSIAATKQKLSSRIDKVDSSLDNVVKLTTATKEQVSELRDKSEVMCLDVNSVRTAVELLGNKISRIEVLQDATNLGVNKLCEFTVAMENAAINNRAQALPSNSRPTIELLPSPSTRVESSRPASALFLESPSPSTSGAHKDQRSPHNTAVSAFGLKDINGISEVARSSSRPDVSTNTHPPEDSINGSSSSGFLGMKFGASLLSRTRSAATSFKFTNNAQ